MKISSITCCATVALALATATAQPASAEMGARIDNAITEAKKAQAASDMDTIRLYLRHACNCLVGRDSGSWHAPDGDTGPCNDRAPAWDEAKGFMQRKKLQDAANKLSAGGGQGRISDAQDYAEDGVKLMEAAKAAPAS